ncbi:phospholipase D-like domain-containing protein [Pseudomonas jilinensis]|uniref:Cardiolipin synthase B n=1 Tax=Pseudomonas jilinensis TaxID=2078689 RepID=A0A396RSU3_9PSED|nr:phosphatidylserine/phosphatidylglycerophosphate/cardiolipin synthase family protein [Pseudomonas jilinensis]RHW19704.1 cardiolipin synthase B [Pseudomonas jilinensis]
MAGPIYPWRKSNTFELLVDGESFFPRMLQAMDGARSSIDLELYLISSGQASRQVLDSLVAAVARGVRVRCLLDGFGSLQLSTTDRQYLLQAGVELRFYNPLYWLAGRGNLHRDHRKLLVIDQTLAFVGGAGLTDDFYRPDQRQSLWHELMLEVRGPVVHDWAELFERQWQVSGRRLRLAPPKWHRVRVPAPPAPDASGYARVSYADAREHTEVVQALLAAVSRSRTRIWLATPYFLPGWRVRRALKRAARRGVDVRLLLCGQITDNAPVRYAGQRFYPGLLKAGVRLYEYQPRFLHLKMVLVDEWVSLGSCNFDHWTLHWNLEANQQVVDPSLNAAVRDCFQRDFAQSREWSLGAWKALGWGHRLKIRLWSWVNRLAVLWFGIRR